MKIFKKFNSLFTHQLFTYQVKSRLHLFSIALNFILMVLLILLTHREIHYNIAKLTFMKLMP